MDILKTPILSAKLSLQRCYETTDDVRSFIPIVQYSIVTGFIVRIADFVKTFQ